MENGECKAKGLICIGLVGVTAAVYVQVAGFDFVNFDDPTYVQENVMVHRGLSLETVRWAFTTFEFANWHPLTWLSYLLDESLFGLRPGPMHLENVLLHLGNTLVLFLLLARMTGRLWPSAVAAALFALHPLHVESVAWISERKDVLSTFFGLLAIGAYARAVTRGSRWTSITAVACYALSLLAKPMLVTLPVLLLLLHIWPLGSRSAAVPRLGRISRLLFWGSLVALAAVSSITTFLAQKSAGAMAPLDYLPPDVRIANAALGLMTYVVKTIVPLGLACPYPHPYYVGRAAHLLGPFYLEAGISAVFLALASWGAWGVRRRFPYVLVGWLWFVVSLMPVIGIVQVGRQAIADRYTYIPSIGLFILVSWGAADGLAACRWRPAVGWLMALVCLVGCSCVTWRQVGYWRNSFTLLERALAVTRGNDIAQMNLSGAYHKRGDKLARQGDWAGAAAQYRAALRVLPYWAEAMNDLALVLMKEGKWEEADALYRRILERFPHYAEAHYNWGTLLAALGRLPEAGEQFREAARNAAESSAKSSQGSPLPSVDSAS